MKGLKNKLLVFFVALLTLSMVGLGAVAFNSKTASASEIFATRNAAEIRLDGNNGMRFVTEVSKSKISGLQETYEGAIFEYGTFVMPADYIEGLEVTEDTFFGENPEFVYGGKVEGKKEVIHIPALLSVQESGDVDLIKGTVTGIKDENLTREYIGIAYIKVTPVDGAPIYELAGLQTEGISMINLATDTLDNDKIVGDDGYKASVDEYIAQYKAYTGIETVNYTVNYNYNGKVVAKTESVAFGSKTNASNVPTDNEEEGIVAGYYYFDSVIANKTARFDGSTVIDVDFTAKAVYEKSAYYGKYILNETKDGKVENTADLSVTLDNEEVVVVSASDIDLTLGNVSVVEDFKDLHVNKVTVTTASNVLMNADDLANWVRLTKDGGGTNWGHGDIITLGADIDATGVSIYYHQNPGYHETTWGFSGVFDGNGHTISNLNSGLVAVTNRTTIKNLKLVDCKKSSPFGSYITSLIIENCEVEFDATGLSEVRLFGGGLRAFQGKANSVTNSTFTVKNATDSTKIVFATSISSGVNFEVANTTVTTNAGKFVAVGDQISDCDFTGAGTKSIESATFNAGSTLTVNTQNVGEDATLVSTAKYATGSNVTVSVDAKAGYIFKGWYNGEELVSSELSYTLEVSADTTLTAVYQVKENVVIKATYGKYILNETKDGRVENPANLVVSYGDVDYVIEKSEFASMYETNGTIKKIAIVETEDSVVFAEVKYVAGVMMNADDLANWIYLAGGGGTNWGHTYIALGADIDATGVSITYKSDPGYHEGSWGYTGTFDGNGYTISNLNSRLVHVTNRTVFKDLKLANCKISQPFTSYATTVTIENCDVEIDATGMSEVRLLANNLKAFQSQASTIKNSTFTIKNASASTVIRIANTASSTLNMSNVTITANAGKFVAFNDQVSAFDTTSISEPIVINSAMFCVPNTITINNQVIDGETTEAQTLKVSQGMSATVTANNPGHIFKGWYKGEELVSSDLSYTFTMTASDVTLTALWEAKETVIVKSAYGKYILNETKDGRVSNTADLVVVYGDKEYTIPKADIISVGVGKEYSVALEETETSVVLAKIKYADAVINTLDDWAGIIYIIAGSHVRDASGYVVLNADLDINGVAPTWTTKGHGYNEPSYGYNGTFDGNGHTLSNGTSEIFGQLRNGATIKNLTVVNHQYQWFIWGCGSLTMENVNITMADSNGRRYILGATQAYAMKGDVYLRNCTIHFDGLNGYQPNHLIGKINTGKTLYLINTTISTYYTGVQLNYTAADADNDIASGLNNTKYYENVSITGA